MRFSTRAISASEADVVDWRGARWYWAAATIDRLDLLRSVRRDMPYGSEFDAVFQFQSHTQPLPSLSMKQARANESPHSRHEAMAR